MNIELIGEKKYMHSILNQKGLWVLMKDNSLYTITAEEGNAVATWDSESKAIDFSNKLNEKMKSMFVPLDLFLNKWLSSTEMNITEILASPKHNIAALTYTTSEFINAAKT